MATDTLDNDFRSFVRSRDPAALAAVFDAAAPRLLLVAMHLTRDSASAEDLVQNVFLQVLRDAAGFDVRRPVMPWLLGLLEHRAADARRRAHRHHERADDALLAASPAAATASAPPDAAASAETRQRVAEALAGMPGDYRQVLTLRLVHGIAAVDIAHSLGLPPATVRTRLSRGLQLLRNALPRGLATPALLAWLGGEVLRASSGLQAVRAKVLAAAGGGAVATATGLWLLLCGMPSLSDDGLFVAFEGRATDTDAVFVRDRIAGLTEPISDATSLGGRCFAPSLSGDGRWVAFVCATGESQQVYVFDRVTDTVQLVSRSSGGAAGNGPSLPPSISRDGRWIAFASEASNLVGNDSNEKIDVFVHDRISGQTSRVSTSSGGAEGNDDSVEAAISADGTRVAFASKAANLVSGDDNGKSDVFVHTLATGATQRVSVNPQGNEVDKESWLPKLSADGSYVAFSSLSDDLVGDDQNGKEDVFCRDLVSGVTRRVRIARGGGDPDDDCTAPALASDAPVVAFVSKAKNMVQGDSNDQDDVFVAPRGN